MRLLELYQKVILSGTPMTTFALFISYIVLMPLMLGLEKDFSCHSHLSLIWVSLLFAFLSAPFLRTDRSDGTLELYSLSNSWLPWILLLQLLGNWLILMTCVLCGLPVLEVLYEFDGSVMGRLNIVLGTLMLTLLCGIHSSLSMGISSEWTSLQNLTTSPTLLPLTISCTSIETEWFHVLSSVGYSAVFVSLFPILVSMSCKD